MKSAIATVLLYCCSHLSASAQKSTVSSTDIIPLPKSIRATGSDYALSLNTKIYYEAGLRPQAELLAEVLSPATGFDLQVLPYKSGQTGGIALTLDKTFAPDKEGYRMSVNNAGIRISAATSAGVFYGTQTLLQLLPVEIYSKTRQRNVSWKVKGADIQDVPQYAFRGMMLDVARYFFNKEYVLHFIDMMAMYKLNTLHLHLTDDSGWRLEIKKYPKLTSIGAWRGEGAERTGGYYTQDDIKEMVAYAAKRNVDIIPEIELPAHALASIAAYPYLCCTGEQYSVQTQHAISKEIYCAGKESTFDFLADVFKETFALFPSKYIHIGGDEANYERWKACPNCQKRKNELGLREEKQLQVYFNQRVQEMIGKYGKTIVGWDEVIEDGLKQKVAGMIWNDPKKALKAVENGHYAIMTLTSHSYYDVPESATPGEVKAATWLKPISLQKAYTLDPMLPGLDVKYRPQILGASAALWSDQFIHGTVLQEIAPINENRSEKYFDYLTLPRMASLAEVTWTPKEQQSWTGFEQRMRRHYNRYDRAGYGYRVPEPEVLDTTLQNGNYRITLSNPVAGSEIRYTTDGSRPNVYSALYTGPVIVDKPEDFSAITVVNRSQYSLPLLLNR